MSRIMRIDENHVAGNLNEGGMKKVVIATRRPVLGELGNKVLRNASQDLVGKGGEKGAVLKNANPTLKNIKPRVDTRWRKVDGTTAVVVPKKPITRSESIKSTTELKAASNGEAVKVHVQLNKGNEIKHVALKREDSQLSLRTLAKQNRKVQQKSAPSSSASSSDENETIPATQKPVQKTERLDTHSQKLLESIENIDANDGWNPMLVSEYVNDIYKYLNQLESRTGYALRENFLEGHKEISHKMRTILIDWINEVHHQFKLDIDTYHMTVSLIDRYLQKVKTVPKKKLQLVGVTAMFIASKYEELFPPEIHDFVFITDDTYQKYQILEMEKEIVNALDFNLGKPLPTHFLRRFSKAAKASDVNHVLAKYLIELASVDYSTAHYKPSEIAAAALYISLYLFPLTTMDEGSGSNGIIWTKTLEHYTHYSVKSLSPIVQRLANVIKSVPKMMEKKLKSPWLKYSSSKFQCISTHPKLKGAEINALAEKELPF
ncbi:G2/mitotic-specific cyclin-B-like isoform X1 [Anopheles moucheti]|uniref:G2/mitotic-specific cyclin-B-like isoform X1 n=1 Tax=Anopheles moucheti TaxID=186751 RepID=UPI0022F10D3B|nr:G2/mitotic-specific cyclin-B-like isoform X1 [Anopheles moucheti]